MESLLAGALLLVANKASTSVRSSSSPAPFVIGTSDTRASAAARPVRCAVGKESILYALEHEEMFNSVEVLQWESGMSFNSIAAAQGIRVRRRFRTRYPSDDDDDDGAVARSTLEQIIWDKEVEVHHRKAKEQLKDVVESAQRAPPPRDFVAALHAARRRNGDVVPALIAEVKKASPHRGVLREHFKPVEIAHAYEKNGAACLSILTDEKYFQGSFEILEAVRNSGVKVRTIIVSRCASFSCLKCPLLCKDFVIDIWQIYYARSKGADAILLIAAVLPDLDMKFMLHVCNNLGMAALIEVHDERELDRVLKIDGVQLISINNHSLETSQVDTANINMLLKKLGDMVPNKVILLEIRNTFPSPARRRIAV
ncbi:hypothetical protein ACP4OV_001973 [Aristida adscensionis]